MKIVAIAVGVVVGLFFMFSAASCLGGYMSAKNKSICIDKGGHMIFIDGTQECVKVEVLK